MSNYISRHYAGIANAIGSVLIVAGFLMITPLIGILFYPDQIVYLKAFLIPSGIVLALGLALRVLFRPDPSISLSIQDGGIIVLVSWSLVVIFSALPFMEALGFSFSRAVFESMSGWTTTGLSVVNVSTAGAVILLWRSIMQFAGGAGLAIIMLSSIMGAGGVGISNAEGRSDQLLPHVRKSARLVLVIYLSYAIAGIGAYKLVGMSYFDAVNHSFAAISTGGFSTYSDSIGHWNSVSVEAITIVLMLLGNLSFITAWSLWRGQLITVSRNPEVRLVLILLPIVIPLIVVCTTLPIYQTLEKSIRVGVFETISAITTTGFSTVGYLDWNPFGLGLMILLMLIGGGTYSTAGGIKQFRVHYVIKYVIWELRSYLLPKSTVADRYIWEGGRKMHVDESYTRPIVVFIFLYLSIFLIGVLVLSACGFSLQDSLFEFASALGTVGLSMGATSYAMPSLALWMETIAMFLGRLEIVVVITSLCKIKQDCISLITRDLR